MQTNMLEYFDHLHAEIELPNDPLDSSDLSDPDDEFNDPYAPRNPTPSRKD
jgi:hypothetical protein